MATIWSYNIDTKMKKKTCSYFWYRNIYFSTQQTFTYVISLYLMIILFDEKKKMRCRLEHAYIKRSVHSSFEAILTEMLQVAENTFCRYAVIHLSNSWYLSEFVDYRTSTGYCCCHSHGVVIL